MAPRDPFGFTGELIDTQLRVGEPAGEGGFSVVYKGHHLGLDEAVAIKCLKLPAGIAPKMIDAIVERFRAESRISYRLSQGNLDIVRSISSGTAHSPTTGVLVPYIALEWLDGPSLTKELKTRRTAGLTGRPLGEVLSLLDPAARALEYAHNQGVIHRDVKPGNLLLAKTRDNKQRIKVLDFGLAKVIDAEGTGLVPTAQTVAQVILCSPSYGAPEQFDSSLGRISTATDVYSFALIVLELLRDVRVRQTESLGAAAKKALDPKPPGPIQLGIPVSPAIDALFLRALALEPSKRPKDMGEFWNELQRLAVQPVSGAMPGAAARPPEPGPVTPAGYAPDPRADVPRPGAAPLVKSALPMTTRLMQRPEQPSVRVDRPEGQKPMGTVIMPERPSPLPPEPRGPVTAPMPAVPPRVSTVHIALSSGTDPTWVGEATGAAYRGGTPPTPSGQPVPGASHHSTLVVPSGQAHGRGQGQGPPAPAGPQASRTSPSSAKVIVLVIVLLLLTSGVVIMGGYLAHYLIAARRAGQ